MPFGSLHGLPLTSTGWSVFIMKDHIAHMSHQDYKMLITCVQQAAWPKYETTQADKWVQATQACLSGDGTCTSNCMPIKLPITCQYGQIKLYAHLQGRPSLRLPAAVLGAPVLVAPSFRPFSPPLHCRSWPGEGVAEGGAWRTHRLHLHLHVFEFSTAKRSAGV